MPECIQCRHELPAGTTVCSHCGQAQPSTAQLSDVLLDEVLVLLGRGHKLEAVKVVRERFGVSLLEAKQIVEQLEAAPNSTPSPTAGANPEKIRELLQQGQKLLAIKLYKEQTGSSLLAAKQYVDALEQTTISSPRRGCLGVVAVVAALLACCGATVAITLVC